MPTERPDRPPETAIQRLLSWLRRRWLLVLAIVAFAVLLILRFGEIEQVLATIVRGQWQWILGAVLLQGMYYPVYTLEYVFGFAAVEVPSALGQLLPVLFASIFFKTIVPSGGISSLAVFIDDATRRGKSGTRTAEGALLVLIADVVSVAPFIVFSLLYLSQQLVLAIFVTIASILFLLFAGLLGAVILLGRWQPSVLRGFFAWSEDNINWLASLVGRPPVLPPGWDEAQARDFTGAARGLAHHPGLLGDVLLVAFGANLINLLTLFALSLAYGEPVNAGALTAAYTMNVVFSVVTFIPHGIGIAETIMVVVLTSLGIATAEAVAITIAFRGLNVWLPLGIGFVFLRQVGSFRGGRRS